MTVPIFPEYTIISGDADGDGQVSVKDLSFLSHCLTGPNVPPTPDCRFLDADHNDHVDLRDLADLQSALVP